MKKKDQTFFDWVYNPSRDDELISNTFRRIVKYAFDNSLETNSMDVTAPDPTSIEWKLATLLYHKRITPEGNKVYVYRNGILSPLPDGMEDLQHLLHESDKNTTKAYGILSHELDGVVRNLVEKDTVGIIEYEKDLFGNVSEKKSRINLKDMKEIQGEDTSLIPEFGWHESDDDRVMALLEFFAEQNSAFECEGEFFFEKAISYPLHQRIREKAFICNGPGGVGKTLMTKVAAKLYGTKGQVGSEPTFTGQDKNRITREFIGKKFIVYNDIESPSTQLMTWLKPMLTGNMTIKGDGGYERSVPCEAVFYLETNFKPQFLGGNQDVRRFIVRSAKSDYKLIDHMDGATLDIVEHGCTAADIARYLMSQNHAIVSAAGGWCHFEERPLPIADFIEIAEEFFQEYPAKITKGVITAYANQNKLTKIELETLKEVFLVEKKKQMEEAAECESAEAALPGKDNLPQQEDSGEGSNQDNGAQRMGEADGIPVSGVRQVAPDEQAQEGAIAHGVPEVLDGLPVLREDHQGAEGSAGQEQAAAIPEMQEQGTTGESASLDEVYLSDF